MTRIFLIAALLALPSTAALAQIDTSGLIAGYQADGYTAIEVTRGLNQTKVEAIRGSDKVEVVYDNATGEVLKTENGLADASDDIRQGVSIRSRDRDFTRDGLGQSSDDSDDDSNSEDDNDGDHGKGHGRGGDDRDDDDHGDDKGSDHSGGDDKGGDDKGGDDGDSNDD